MGGITDLGSVLDGLRTTANDWAPAIQALAAIAALAVAVVATRTAKRAQVAEEAQASSASKALADSQATEKARQREVQLLAITPTSLTEPVVSTWSGMPVAVLDGQVPTTNPAMRLGVTLRRLSGGESVSADRGSLAPNARWKTRLVISQLMRRQADSYFVAEGGLHEVVVTFRGPLDQRVVEHYHWYLHHRWNDVHAPNDALRWRLARFEVAITERKGIDDLDLRFDD